VTASAGAGAGLVTSGSVDLAFVGGGVSTSYVLLALLAALVDRPSRRPVSIAVLDPDPTPFAGVAYGPPAAATALLITDLHDFLPPAERVLLERWLAARGDDAFAAFRAAAGPVSRRWWERHRTALHRGEVEHLYLPRRVFGDHLAERVGTAVAAARAAGAADTRVVGHRVRTLAPDRGGWALEVDGARLLARTVVLAVGSPPVASLLPAHGGPGALVDRPFDSMDATRDRVAGALRARGRRGPPHVVVVGGNAGAMDVVHLVADLEEDVLRRATVTVLSPGGRLPARAADARSGGGPGAGLGDGAARLPGRLTALAGTAHLRARDLHDAAVADIADGEACGLSAARTLGPVSAAVGRLLPQLSPEQGREFAGRWGAELGRHQRRAGWEYHEVVDELTAAGRFRLVAGTLAGVGVDPDGVRVDVHHEGATVPLPAPADVVLNCTGPAPDLRDVPVVADLVTAGTVATTVHGRGVAVDDDLAAAAGLHVMGPLLAGNLVGGAPLWHLEHCGRISALGGTLGRHLHDVVRTRP
jgi:uncharacterized NAD(P)/FAD-binding protein YdhS